jgi:hypothetical protein
MIHEYGAFGIMRIGRETEVFGGNLPQCHLVHHKSQCPILSNEIQQEIRSTIQQD